MSIFKATKEQADFIKSNVKGITAIELTEIFNKKFNTNITVNQIRTFKKNHKLKSGIDCTFKKGNVPVNKGTKGLTGTNKTSFKKGHKPHNTKPIGSETITDDGYIKVKIAEPNKWEFKQRLIWSKVNGKIPKGGVILFADGDKQNFNIDNLVLITKKELLVMMQNGLITQYSDLTKTGNVIAKMIIKIREREKDGI